MLERNFRNWTFRYDQESKTLLVFRDTELISKSSWEWSEQDFMRHFSMSIRLITLYESPIVQGNSVLVNDSSFNGQDSLKEDWSGRVESVSTNGKYVIEYTDRKEEKTGSYFIRDLYQLEKIVG